MPEKSHHRSSDPRRYRRVLVASVAFAATGTLVLGACQGGGEEPKAKPSSSTSSSAAAAEADGLDDLFADDDGDGIPNRIQKSIGEDGTKDVCASKVCKTQEQSQNAALAKIVRGTSTMIILDSSGSMVSKTSDGQTRMAAAKKAIRNYVANSPKSTERLGMMVYGQEGSNQRKDRPESCRKIDTLQPIGDLTKSNVSGTLSEFEPTGWTPIARSLAEASKKFDNERNRVNKIIVVTDGMEECGGDPQAEARKLRRSGFNVSIDVVGMGVSKDAPAKKQLTGIADAGGGRFTAVNDTKGMESYFNQVLASWVATAKVGDCVSKHFPDYSACQALRWQKAQPKMNAEIQKLRDDGQSVPADQLEQRTTEAGQYFLTTLTTRGLSAAQDFTPSSDEVKQIEKHLEKSADGRAALERTKVPCGD